MNHLLVKLFLRMIIYCLFIYLCLSLYFFYLYIHPHRFISAITPADVGLAYEDIKLKTKDNIILSGWFIPQENSNKAIIVCHGYPADKGNVLGLAFFLAPKYNLLLFDFRALGKSQGKISTGGWREREDFLAAVEFLKGRGFKDIGAFGFSMGAAVILMSKSQDIKAIVTDSSYANLDLVIQLIFRNFGVFRYPFVGIMKLWSRLLLKLNPDEVSPLKCISGIKVPILLIHSERDSQIPVEHVELLYKANPKTEVWIIPEADHGRGLLLRQEEYQERVFKFFAGNL